MNKPEQVIDKYVAENYGDLILPDKPNYDQDTKTWETVLRSTYPRIIHDEKLETVIVRFLRLTDLGIIRLNDKLEITEATSRENCDEQLVSRIELWKRYAEQIVIGASSNIFAKIAEGIHVLNPLKLVLDNLVRPISGQITITESQIEEQDRSQRIRQYLEMLEELKIVRKTDGGYAYGNTFTALAERTKNDQKLLRTALLSHVIKEKYPTLRQVFRITQLDPFIRVDNCYYWHALDAEKLVHTTQSSLYQRYLINYGWISTWDFQSKISDLEEYGALIEEQGYLTGNQEQFDRMLEIKHTSVELNP